MGGPARVSGEGLQSERVTPLQGRILGRIGYQGEEACGGAVEVPLQHFLAIHSQLDPHRLRIQMVGRDDTGADRHGQPLGGVHRVSIGGTRGPVAHQRVAEDTLAGLGRVRPQDL